MRFLISIGANVNDQENLARYTPLHIACEVGASDLVKVLLENGVDPNRQDTGGRTALHV